MNEYKEKVRCEEKFEKSNTRKIGMSSLFNERMYPKIKYDLSFKLAYFTLSDVLYIKTEILRRTFELSYNILNM